MTNIKIPSYITELKTDIINHIDSSINTLALTIHNTVALKEDLENLAIKSDLKEIWDNLATKSDLKEVWEHMVTKSDIKDMATKSDIKEIQSLIGSYEVRARNIEDILLEDHKPRIADLEKVVYSD